MRISEEIDALEVMGVNSFIYLVATRVWAAVLAMVPLYLAALFSSFLASQLIVTKFFGLSPGTYAYYFRLFLPPVDILDSFIKAMIFAVVVAVIHCYYGYKATGGPAGVGIAAGRAIRASIISVVVLDLVLSLIMFGGASSTARLVG
jgi:phospholipid/cholesterol/gamma-HCH transport system permease protein